MTKTAPAVVEELRAELLRVFPYVSFSTCLGSLAIYVSLEPRARWSNDIFHNSPYLICGLAGDALTHVNTTFHRKAAGDCVNLPKIRKLAKATVPAIVGALTKWKMAAADVIKNNP